MHFWIPFILGQWQQIKAKFLPFLPQGEAIGLYLQAYNLWAALLTSKLPQDQVSTPWQTGKQQQKNFKLENQLLYGDI